MEGSSPTNASTYIKNVQLNTNRQEISSYYTRGESGESIARRLQRKQAKDDFKTEDKHHRKGTSGPTKRTYFLHKFS